jgi:serine/threonine-protein kinase HipA
LQSSLIENEDAAFDGLFGVFNDSLPDGWGKLLVDRALLAKGIPHQSLTPLDRLSLVGSHGMGALKYRPEQYFESQSATTIELDTVASKVQDVLEGNASDIIEELLAFGGSSAGARPKILVGYCKETEHIISGTDELPEGYDHWLIKFPSSTDATDIAQIELAYARMAKEAGIEMSETRLFDGKSGHSFFGTKRFDRNSEKRLHMLTAAGLLHSSHRFPSLDYSDLMNATLHLTKDHREMEKVFRLCCFNVLTHNRDDHSKNFSFLMDANGEWKFAPAYDLTFSFGPGGHQSTMVLGEGKAPNRTHLQKLASEFGLKKGNVIIDDVETAVGKWSEMATESGVTPNSVKVVSIHLSV